MRLQRGIAAISAAKILWAIFEEDECRAAQWLHEAGLSHEKFWETFGIDMLQGSDDEPKEQPEGALQPIEPPKYSSYPPQQQGLKRLGQSRLQFYLDDQLLNIGLFTPEVEDDLETAALRFIRQDRQSPIAVTGGAKQVALGVPVFTLTTEHLLLAVVLDNGDIGHWLRENGLDAAELYQRIDALLDDRHLATDDFEAAMLPEDEQNVAVCSQPSAVSYYRLLDAAANRGREAIRVIEDYVRFILDDADLTQRLKTFRHQFQNVLHQFPMQSRLEARNTEQDVGTEISAEGEYERPTVNDLLSANFSRLQESLRSLEEFSKMFDSQAARKFEQLRYQGYTLQKDVLLTEV